MSVPDERRAISTSIARFSNSHTQFRRLAHGSVHHSARRSRNSRTCLPTLTEVVTGMRTTLRDNRSTHPRCSIPDRGRRIGARGSIMSKLVTLTFAVVLTAAVGRQAAQFALAFNAREAIAELDTAR